MADTKIFVITAKSFGEDVEYVSVDSYTTDEAVAKRVVKERNDARKSCWDPEFDYAEAAEVK